MKPKLVVITAYPASGKTTITKYLEEIGFVRLSGDEEIEAVYGSPDWFGNITEEQKQRAFDILYGKKDRNLSDGRDVVIDTTGHSQGFRKDNFCTRVTCDKYLIWIKTDPGLQAEIVKSKGWGENAIEEWKKEMGWEDPVESGDYELIVYTNNGPGDLEHIKQDLKNRFSGK